jgi:hypothetical protein
MPGLRDEQIRQEIYEAMQENKPPYAAYIKTTVGRVSVKYLDPIRLVPAEVVLKGDPSEVSPDDITFKVWTVAEDVYFQRNNKINLEEGYLVPVSVGAIPQVDTTNQISDAEIESILSQPYFALKNKLAEFTSSVPVRRFLLKAEQMNRPVGTVRHIQSVLSEMEQNMT